ncbi:MAG: FAD-binding oxidoreductase [Desulfobacteraceae bacterium]|nr:FAD-binding oxidoreductase [Desulfobacteraceae bacterium]
MGRRRLVGRDIIQIRTKKTSLCPPPALPILGTDPKETSVFLPQVVKRMVELMPRLKNIRVKRVWRSLYPMPPDGSPILGRNRDVQSLIHATGMCGQGFMLGPGMGEIVARMITHQSTDNDNRVLDEYTLYREFGGEKGLQ